MVLIRKVSVNPNNGCFYMTIPKIYGGRLGLDNKSHISFKYTENNEVIIRKVEFR
jgi:allophanate hydrolase subunit 1